MSDSQLMNSVKNGDLAVLKELLQDSVDVNEQDEQGWTALSWAAGKGDLEAVQLLLDKGADVSKVGRDQRTPYMIALAADKVEVARALRAAEAKAGGDQSGRPERQYCKVYQVSALRRFPDWKENHSNGAENNGNGSADEFAEDDVVFLHQDFTVTRSMWHNEDVIFDQVSPEWKEFCTNVLEFKVPDDLDLIASVANATH